jgi:hypothetical protein
MKKRLYDNNANLKQYADRFKAEQPFVSFTTPPMEHCIVYVSSSVSLCQETDLIFLLEQSRSHNVTAGITGILLIHQGSIVQVLEGKQETIEALYKQIKEDQRHTDVIKIVECPIEARLFAGWSMRCKSITDHQLELIKTIVDLGKVDWLRAKPSTNSIVNLLKSDYQSVFHFRQRLDNPVVPTLLHDHVQEWKQQYRQLAQAVEAIKNEFRKRSIDLKEPELVSLAVSQEQRIKEITRLLESNRMVIWERQQGELSQNFMSF